MSKGLVLALALVAAPGVVALGTGAPGLSPRNTFTSTLEHYIATANQFLSPSETGHVEGALENLALAAKSFLLTGYHDPAAQASKLAETIANFIGLQVELRTRLLSQMRGSPLKKLQSSVTTRLSRVHGSFSKLLSQSPSPRLEQDRAIDNYWLLRMIRSRLGSLEDIIKAERNDDTFFGQEFAGKLAQCNGEGLQLYLHATELLSLLDTASRNQSLLAQGSQYVLTQVSQCGSLILGAAERFSQSLVVLDELPPIPARSDLAIPELLELSGFLLDPKRFFSTFVRSAHSLASRIGQAKLVEALVAVARNWAYHHSWSFYARHTAVFGWWLSKTVGHPNCANSPLPYLWQLVKNDVPSPEVTIEQYSKMAESLLAVSAEYAHGFCGADAAKMAAVSTKLLQLYHSALKNMTGPSTLQQVPWETLSSHIRAERVMARLFQVYAKAPAEVPSEREYAVTRVSWQIIDLCEQELDVWMSCERAISGLEANWPGEAAHPTDDNTAASTPQPRYNMHPTLKCLSRLESESGQCWISITAAASLLRQMVESSSALEDDTAVIFLQDLQARLTRLLKMINSVASSYHWGGSHPSETSLDLFAPILSLRIQLLGLTASLAETLLALSPQPQNAPEYPVYDQTVAEGYLPVHFGGLNLGGGQTMNWYG